MHVWIIGSGGMLGSALVAQAHGRSLFAPEPVPWDDPDEAAATLEAECRRFVRSTGNQAWAIVWAAGSSVVSSSPHATSSELTVFSRLLDAIAIARPAGAGAFFLTSSAGGVYAGSSNPPFTASTAPRPISPYGELKLSQEQVATTRLSGLIPLAIGRFSNLYGPGHNEAKGQGLIPLLCLATVRRTPLNLFVSMDTVRDYLYVDDAALMAWDAIDQVLADQPAEARTFVIASGQPTTVAQVIATVQNVAHRRVPLALGTHPSAQHQAVDLRLVPSSDLICSQSAMTTLPSGIKRLFDAAVGRVN